MDELISKRAVIEAIEKARANVGHNLERSIGKSIIEILDEVGEDVGKLPSAQPKRGVWNYNSKIGTFKVWTCDQCGWNYEAEFNFCPNCGAKMEVTE